MNPESAYHFIDIRQVILINEDIKSVLGISSTTKLVAINSMLISKASKERLLGFRVVSSEIIGFSRKLDEAMLNLVELTFDMLRNVTNFNKVSRECLSISRTMQKNSQSKAYLGSALLNKQQQWRQLSESAADKNQIFLTRLKRVERLCKLGNAIGRNARIEAAYGGEQQKQLMLVAEHIEATVVRILAIMKNVKQQTGKLK